MKNYGGYRDLKSTAQKIGTSRFPLAPSLGYHLQTRKPFLSAPTMTDRSGFKVVGAGTTGTIGSTSRAWRPTGVRSAFCCSSTICLEFIHFQYSAPDFIIVLSSFIIVNYVQTTFWDKTDLTTDGFNKNSTDSRMNFWWERSANSTMNRESFGDNGQARDQTWET